MLLGFVAVVQGAVLSTDAEREFALSQARLADGSGVRATAEFSDTYTSGVRAASRQVCAIYVFEVNGVEHTFKAPRACGINAPMGIYGLEVPIVYSTNDPNDATLVRTERTERTVTNNRTLAFGGVGALLVGGIILTASMLRARRKDSD